MCLYASSCTHTHIDCWCGVHSGVAIFTQSELSLNNSKQDGPWCHLREHDEISHQCVVKSPPTAAHHTYAPQSARRRPRMDRPTKQPEGVVSRRVTAGHNGSQRVSDGSANGSRRVTTGQMTGQTTGHDGSRRVTTDHDGSRRARRVTTGPTGHDGSATGQPTGTRRVTTDHPTSCSNLSSIFHDTN